MTLNPTPIRAVLFDMGGTLEDIYFDDALRLEATRGLSAILQAHQLDPGLKVADLYALVDAGMKKYAQWRERTDRELPPEEVWTEFVFTGGLPQARLAEIGEELAFYYDTHFYTRTLRPEVPAVLQALRARGLRLGLISNTFSRGQVPHNLARYGIRDCFEAVIISSSFGRRKPHPSILLEGARQLSVPPAACAYVGDTVSRDVSGARRAGYGLAIQIKSFLTTRSDTEKDTEPPDAVITALDQVVALVEGRALAKAQS